ncbi:MAG: hypothetical protein HKN06_08670 [Gammaproteobacteria bacterium]|nr:hypothetical protein [Gammaproteobacteria bacterium]
MKTTGYASLAALLLLAGAHAGEMSSANYSISWDVTDGGGGLMTSASYVLVDSVGQPSAIGASSSASYILTAGFHAAPDTDTDLVRDFLDNCSLDPNSDQFDSNSDGFGNICDADLNDDGFVDLQDLAVLRTVFLTQPGNPAWNPDADFNNDGAVDLIDASIMRVRFLQAPGPSGIAP